MKIYTKRIFFLLIVFSVLYSLNSCRSKTPWNPYLSAKEKPNDKQRKVENKQIVIGKKAYKERLKKNKKEIKENNDRFYSKNQQYKSITKINKRKRKEGNVRWKL